MIKYDNLRPKAYFFKLVNVGTIALKYGRFCRKDPVFAKLFMLIWQKRGKSAQSWRNIPF